MPDYLAWFVDRTKEYKGLQTMLARRTRRTIMLIEGPADMGKSWLLQNMRHYCVENAIPVMYVDFRDRRPYDYLSLVRRARDQIGPEHFNALTATINSFTGVTINLSTPASGVNIRDIAGSDVDIKVGGDFAPIKDNHFYVQADSEAAHRAAEIRINDAFFACLSSALREEAVVFLFDSYEEVTKEAERWIRDELLLRMGEGQLERAILIIAGRNVPKLNLYLKPLVAKTRLSVLNEQDVREYIIERRQLLDLDLPTIVRTSGGYPGLLAKMADIAAMETEDDDDWL
jgi:hypothetical protein